MLGPHLWVVQSIYPEVQSKLTQAKLDWAAHSLTCTKENWISDVISLTQVDRLSVVILPGEWFSEYLSDSLSPNVQEILARVNAGMLRIAYWECQPAPLSTFPVFFLTSKRGSTLFEASLRHLRFAAMPGIHSLLPTETDIYAGRVRGGLDVGQELDKMIAYMASQWPFLENQGMRIRLAMSAVLVASFENSGFKKTKEIPLSINFGAAEGMAVGCFKWRTSSDVLQEWKRIPELLQTASAYSDALWLHLIPESSEVEVLLFFDREESGWRHRDLPLPWGFDVLTNARLSAVGDDFEGRLKDFRFHPLRKLTDAERAEPLKPSPVCEEVQASSRPHRDFETELMNLRLELRRMENIVSNYQEQVVTLTKKLTQALVSESSLKQDLRSIEIRFQQTLAKEAERIKKISGRAG